MQSGIQFESSAWNLSRFIIHQSTRNCAYVPPSSSHSACPAVAGRADGVVDLKIYVNKWKDYSLTNHRDRPENDPAMK